MSFLNVQPKFCKTFLKITKDCGSVLDFENYSIKFHNSDSWIKFEKKDFLDVANYLEVKKPSSYFEPKYKPLHEFKWGDNTEDYGFFLWQRVEEYLTTRGFFIDIHYVVYTIKLNCMDGILRKDYRGMMITHLPTGKISFNTYEEDIESQFRRCLKKIEEKIKNES